MNRVTNHETRMLREARLRLGLSQQKVAAMVGIQIRHYQRYEYGERSMRNVNMELGLSICAVLQIDPFMLIQFEGKQDDAPMREDAFSSGKAEQ